MLKVIVAPDSFKGSLTAVDLAKAMKKGIQKADEFAEVHLLPVADGGEGTMQTLVTATNGQVRRVKVTGPLGRQVEAAYGVLGDGKTCVIEVASASGLMLVPPDQLNPLQTTTYGTGELIKAALEEGFTSFIFALGGSATNDGGVGMLQALGAKVLDADGAMIGFGGGQLASIQTIDLTSFDDRLARCTITIASDVQNPLVGKNGASAVFGPQKGARQAMVQVLEQNLLHWANLVEEVTGISLHQRPGAGAAGGIGGAFQVFFPATMKRGIDVVLNHIDFEKYVKGADFVLTGEGSIDEQTSLGKTPLGVAQAAQKMGVPTIVLAGSVGEGIESLYEHGVVSVHSILDGPMSLEEAVKNTGFLVEKSSEQIMRLFSLRKVDLQ